MRKNPVESPPPDDEVWTLTEQAFDALNAGDMGTAHTLAMRLREMNCTAWFEIEAKAFLKFRHRNKNAIAVLREGLDVAPSWKLWNLLGYALHREDEYEDALDCYNRALECEGVDSHAVIFHRAQTLERLNRKEEALQSLEESRAMLHQAKPKVQIHTELLRLWLLTRHECSPQILQNALGLRERAGILKEYEDAENTANFWANLARVFYDCGEDNVAHETNDTALALDRYCQRALQQKRIWQLDAIQANHRFEVVLRGEKDEEAKFIFLCIVADTAQHAIDLVMKMEAPHWKKSLQFEEYEMLGECKLQNAGIYSISTSTHKY